MEQLEGTIESIIFRNPDNGYTVFEVTVKGEKESMTCVGKIVNVDAGEYVRLLGNYTEHPVYGRQFAVETCDAAVPADALAFERYLASGAIKGIGKAMAAKIVKYFGDETFEILEHTPERLAEVRGISERMAASFAAQFDEKREQRNAMVFLGQYGIGNSLAVKVYERYGARLYEIIRNNPYRLAEDINGVGFKTADEIAARAGISLNSENRIRAGLLYVMQLGNQSGHTYLPENIFVDESCRILGVAWEQVLPLLSGMLLSRHLILREYGGERHIYSAPFYFMELNCARMLSDLDIRAKMSKEVLQKKVERVEAELKLCLDKMQRLAVAEAALNGIFVLTGGPGTGKTTTINALIRFFENEGMEVLLAAPTGRAAKRMKEATGKEASTIHRLLGATGSSEDSGAVVFERDENSPLEADVIIIDEMSMVDISLMNSLLKAVPVGTRLVMVGDANQLPSVGPGNVLRDIIASGRFSVVRLETIFRQAESSDIVKNAHRVNAGEHINLNNNKNSGDFFFLPRENVSVIAESIVYLVSKKLPPYVKARPFDIQVLTPTKKGELGVSGLNTLLQKNLNPPEDGKPEIEAHGVTFREGDKVMQVKNNYRMSWEVRNRRGIPVDSGQGVFNGDMGMIFRINKFSQTVTVLFDDEKYTEYGMSDLDELELAYAITVHKAQGSEYPAVVMPVLAGPEVLFNRNLLYTAITRAKKCVTIIGSERRVDAMIDNGNEQKRYSGLKECLEELH